MASLATGFDEARPPPLGFPLWRYWNVGTKRSAARGIRERYLKEFDHYRPHQSFGGLNQNVLIFCGLLSPQHLGCMPAFLTFLRH